jgi:nicotinate-nucleotide--dimethylbenzimidazole phosphoribosyltransferase
VSVGPVLRHVISSITPASEAHRQAAERRLRQAGPMFDRLGGALAAARHGALRRGRRSIVVAAGDHGAGDPGIALGAHHPTVIAAAAVAAGEAAVCQLARAATADLLLLDCGCAESPQLPASAVVLGRHPSGDARRGAALTIVEVTSGLEAGVATMVSLVDAGTETLAIGAIGLGSEVGAAAIAGALLGPARLSGEAVELGRAARELAESHHLDPLGVLAAFGGPETAVLAGMILAAASMNVPVVLDGEATGAAALIAAALAPPVPGYLIASQRGSGAMPAMVDALGLAAVFAAGVGHGEGAGAALVLGLIDPLLAAWQTTEA